MCAIHCLQPSKISVELYMAVIVRMAILCCTFHWRRWNNSHFKAPSSDIGRQRFPHPRTLQRNGSTLLRHSRGHHCCRHSCSKKSCGCSPVPACALQGDGSASIHKRPSFSHSLSQRVAQAMEQRASTTTGRFYWSKTRGSKVDTKMLSAQVVAQFGENVLKRELSAQRVTYKGKDTAVIKVIFC